MGVCGDKGVSRVIQGYVGLRVYGQGFTYLRHGDLAYARVCRRLCRGLGESWRIKQ